MKRVFIFCALLLCTNLSFGQTSEIKQLDSLFHYLDKNNQEIGEVSIMKNGQTIYSFQLGTPYLKGVDKPMFRVGSITKMITSVLTLRLVEENRLSLNEKLSTFFPEMPNAGEIAVHDLLDHTSGLGDFTLKDDSLFFWLSSPVEKKDIFDEIQRQKILFQPGEGVEYSNSGYYLLSVILERIYDLPFDRLVKQYIIEPLGLRTSVSNIPSAPNIMESYQLNTKNEWVKVLDFYFPNVLGIGDIASTSNDLNQITNALFSYKIVSEKSLHQMLPDSTNRFGKGLMRFPFYQHIFYGHAGDTYGSHAITMHNPEDGITISICMCGTAYPLESVLVNVLNILYGKPFTLPTFPEPYNKCTIGELNILAGIYQDLQKEISFSVEVRNNNLMVIMEGQPPMMLEAHSSSLFGNSTSQAMLEFQREVNAVTLRQGPVEVVLYKKQQ